MQLPLSLSLPSSRTLRTRLRPLVVLGAVAGGAYALVGSAVRVLQESQQRLADERRDRENLKRRFAQNQDDVSFTVLALLPTLAEQLWAQMDVEAVTASLQQGRKVPAPAPQLEQPAPRQEEPRPVEPEPYTTTNGTAEQEAQPEPDAQTEHAAADAATEAPDVPDAAQTPAEPSAAVEAAAAAATDSEADAPSAPAASAAPSAPLEADASLSSAPAAAASAADVDVDAGPISDGAAQSVAAAASPAAASAIDTDVQPESQEAQPKKLRSLSASAAAFVPKGLAQPQSVPHEILAEEKPVEDKVELLQQEQGQQQQEERPHLNGSAQNGEALPNGQAAPEAAGASALDSIAEPPPPAIPADARLAPPPAAEQPAPAEPTHDAAVYVNGAAEAPLSNGTATHEVDATTEQADSTPTPPAVPELSEEEKKEQLRREQRAKLELWNELRIVSISRTLTSLYALVLLTLQTSVQLNVLGRRAYLDSVSALYPRAAPSTISSDKPHQIRLEPGGAGTGADGWGRLDEEEEEKERKETEQLFLTFSWWFLHRGWEEIAALVRESVGEVFGALPLKTPLSHADFLAHLADVRRRIEYDADAEAGGLGASMMSDVRSERSGLSSMRRGKRRNFATALYPAGEEAELDVLVRAGAVSRESTRIPTALRALLDETRDVLESRDFQRVLRLSLNRVFAELDEALRPAFGVPPPKPPGVPSMALERFKEVDDEEEEGKRVRLAALLPAIARQSQLILCAVPNTYAEALADLNELKAWSAIVYTAWDR